MVHESLPGYPSTGAMGPLNWSGEVLPRLVHFVDLDRQSSSAGATSIGGSHHSVGLFKKPLIPGAGQNIQYIYI